MNIVNVLYLSVLTEMMISFLAYFSSSSNFSLSLLVKEMECSSSKKMSKEITEQKQKKLTKSKETKRRRG
jgi:hypothetical protein